MSPAFPFVKARIRPSLSFSMHQTVRALVVLACVTSAGACSETPTFDARESAMSGQRAVLAFVPTWTPTSRQAYAALSAMSVDITSARIQLSNAAGVVVVDTTVSFPLSSDALTVQLEVRISGSQQTFSATFELRDGRNVVQFASSQQVVARAGDANATLLRISLEYVGPGSGARSITVSPTTGTVAPGGTAELFAAALDVAGRSVSDATVRWTTSDAAVATVTATGNTSAIARGSGRRGVVTFSAILPSGLTGSAQLTFLPLPSRLAVVSGGGQTGGGGVMLAAPFVVELIGVDGLPVANQLVTFRAVTAGGKVGTTNASTDAAGRASTSMTPGIAAGTYEFAAQSGALSVSGITVTAFAQIQPIVFLLPLSPLPSQIVVGIAPPEFSAQLSDAGGNPVRVGGVRCTLAAVIAPGGGTFSASAISDVNGVVRVSIPAYQGPPGDATITITVDGVGVVATMSIKVVARP